MQTTPYAMATSPRPHKLRIARKSSSARMLKACGFSREELHALVADMLG